MKSLIHFAICAAIVVMVSCNKEKVEGNLPQLEDGAITQVTAAQIAWLEQIAAKKRDSMRIADSMSNITGIVDTTSLFHRKNKMIALVEVNDHYFPNTLYFQDAENHKSIFDLSFAFSANLNISVSTGRPYIKYNPEMTAMNQAGMIKHMIDNGMKVGLSLLGNHDAAGWANFISIEDAKAFAQLVAIEVRSKGYSAVLSDNEYSSGNYGTPMANAYLVAMAEIKKLLPDIYLCYYVYATVASGGTYEGKTMGDWADAAFSPYYPSNFVSEARGLGFPISKVYPASSETDGSYPDPMATAQSIKAAGQPGFMFFNVCGRPTSANFYAPFLMGLRGQNIYVPSGKLVSEEKSGINNTIQ